MENASAFSKEDKDNYVVRHVLSLFKKSHLTENLVQHELWMIAGLMPRGIEPHDGLGPRENGSKSFKVRGLGLIDVDGIDSVDWFAPLFLTLPRRDELTLAEFQKMLETKELRELFQAGCAQVPSGVASVSIRHC